MKRGRLLMCATLRVHLCRQVLKRLDSIRIKKLVLSRIWRNLPMTLCTSFTMQSYKLKSTTDSLFCFGATRLSRTWNPLHLFRTWWINVQCPLMWISVSSNFKHWSKCFSIIYYAKFMLTIYWINVRDLNTHWCTLIGIADWSIMSWAFTTSFTSTLLTHMFPRSLA